MKLTALRPLLPLLLLLATAAATAPQSLRAAIPNTIATHAGNNAFSSSTTITAPYSVSAGTDISTFNSEGQEPSLPGQGNTAWWNWTAPTSGWCTVDTLLSSRARNPLANTVLGVYRGPTPGNLITMGTSDDVGDYHPSAPALSRVTFYAQKDVTYHIMADAAAGVSIGPNNKEIILRLRHHDLTPGTRDAAFLIRDEHSITLQGTLTATSTSTGRLTGKLVTNLRTWSFTGSYSVDGYYDVQLDMPVIKGQPPAPPVSLRLDNVGDGSYLIARGSEIMDYLQPYFPRRQLYANDAPGRGLHTFADMSTASGYGTGSLLIKPNGAVTLAGIAPDGSPFTQASHLHPLQYGGGASTHHIHGHTTLLKGKGGYTLSLTYRPTHDRAVNGISALTRPATTSPTAPYYASGLNVTGIVFGRAYTPPAHSTASPMDFISPTGGPCLLSVDADPTELPGGLSSPLTYTPPGKFTFGEAPLLTRPKLTLNPKTGLVTGSFVDATGLTRKLRGLLIRTSGGDSDIYGQATGRHRTLPFTITP